jgi:hypothetical protein
MKRSIIAAVMLVGTVLTAHAVENDVWNDIRQPWRSNAEMDSAVKADARACEREVGVQRGPLTAKFKKCMLRHDWQFSHATRTRSSPTVVRNNGTPADNSNDDMVRIQREQDNTQQMINNQQMLDNQQRLNDEQFNQNQNQMMMNNQ